METLEEVERQQLSGLPQEEPPVWAESLASSPKCDPSPRELPVRAVPVVVA